MDFSDKKKKPVLPERCVAKVAFDTLVAKAKNGKEWDLNGKHSSKADIWIYQCT